MILAIDVGNTNIVIGLYEQEKLRFSWRISTNKNKTADELAMMFNQLFTCEQISFQDINGVIISSVVPPLISPLQSMVEQYFKLIPVIVGPGIKTGIEIGLENPKELGADRIVNAIAAIAKYGTPLIIVDFGTATTFDYIDVDGIYQGGAIAPGINISTEALFQKAAKLPRIELVKPRSVIGKNTVNAMQSGIIYGFVGQVDAIVERIIAESMSSPKVIATGGMADLIASESNTIHEVNNLLTIDGLIKIYNKNN